MLAASRAALGEDLAGGMECGADLALRSAARRLRARCGAWIVDAERRSRRAIIPADIRELSRAEADIAALIRDDGGFLARAETAGLDAIASRVSIPDDVAVRLAAEALEPRTAPREMTPELRPCGGALWWSTACNTGRSTQPA